MGAALPHEAPPLPGTLPDVKSLLHCSREGRGWRPAEVSIHFLNEQVWGRRGQWRNRRCWSSNQRPSRSEPPELLEQGGIRTGVGSERCAGGRDPGCAGPTIFRPMYSQPGRTDSRKAFLWAPSENRVRPQARDLTPLMLAPARGDPALGSLVCLCLCFPESHCVSGPGSP